jgi:hypothetical protein
MVVTLWEEIWTPFHIDWGGILFCKLNRSISNGLPVIKILSYLSRSNLGLVNTFPVLVGTLDQCFSTAGPRPGTGPWHQLYLAARDLTKLQYATRFHQSS